MKNLFKVSVLRSYVMYVSFFFRFPYRCVCNNVHTTIGYDLLVNLWQRSCCVYVIIVAELIQIVHTRYLVWLPVKWNVQSNVNNLEKHGILEKWTLCKNRAALFVDDLDIEKSQILSHLIRSCFNQDIVTNFSRFQISRNISITSNKIFRMTINIQNASLWYYGMIKYLYHIIYNIL